LEVRFKSGDLDRLETDPAYDAGFSQAIVRQFRKCMQVIRQAPDERVFRNMKSLHFEKLKGKRQHQNSMRLNEQWRLVVELEGVTPNKIVVVISIEDYH
jgi:proteic killer suppression protein